ncbi:hypothetical protein T440DRAFT_204541 [Plenodomus tracheiphilus IPT5]|uniref:Uncharacterized protein n=1 Tax=Plenodomus tracheiphilus IPT5 TaxID=1408161 RepID=A0A6A7BL10_9PLEO|nr:hypothetical protein T440DRAFT_204541 [Plenodomus tracheiphilus IPT5]
MAAYGVIACIVFAELVGLDFVCYAVVIHRHVFRNVVQESHLLDPSFSITEPTKQLFGARTPASKQIVLLKGVELLIQAIVSLASMAMERACLLRERSPQPPRFDQWPDLFGA